MSKRGRIILKLLIGWALIWPLVAWVGAKLLITESPIESADAIVVLGGSANYKERARAAAKLLQEGRSPRVLVTNDNMRGPWSNAQQRNPFFYERSLEEIANAGVSTTKVELLPQPVANTHEEAELVKQYAEEHQLHSVLIVTSAYHSRRALWVFSRVFRDTGIRIGLIHVRPGDESPRPATWWFSLRGWRLVPTEYVKLVYYVTKY